MKKQFIYIIAGAVVLGVGTVAHAQTPVAPATAPQVTPVVPTMATPTQPVDAKAAKKAKLQEAARKVEQSLEVRIANLESLAARIQTRIGKMQLEGKDVTAANIKLTEARAAIAVAKTELNNLKKADAVMVASAKPATAFANIKNKTAKNVVTRIKAAHKALVDTIVLMKGQGTPSSATSTIQ